MHPTPPTHTPPTSQNLAGKPYAGHIIQTYYAVENNLEDEDDEQVSTRDPPTYNPWHPPTHTQTPLQVKTWPASPMQDT